MSQHFKTQFTNHKSNGLQDKDHLKVADSYNATSSYPELFVYGSSLLCSHMSGELDSQVQAIAHYKLHCY